MPGIENFAPERTETSSGLLVEPNVRPDGLLQLADVATISASIAGVQLVGVGVPQHAGRRRDREPGGHRQAGVGHLGQVGALAAEQVAQRAVAVGLAAAEEVHVLRRLAGRLRAAFFTDFFGAGLAAFFADVFFACFFAMVD